MDLPIIRTWAEAEALEPPLTQAELDLRSACLTGEPCLLSDGRRPDSEEKQPDRVVRADILRFFILGGDTTGLIGVELKGAYITGSLNLNFVDVSGATRLENCRFEKQIFTRQTRFELLNLSGSAFPGINAQGATVAGNVILRDCVSTAKVSFSGAQIGRQFLAAGAQFSSETDFSLNLQGAVINGPVFLHPILAEAQERVETPFTSKGCVSLSRAQVGALYADKVRLVATLYNDVVRAPNMVVKGDVRLNGAEIEGEVKLEGSRIEGNLECEKASLTNPDGFAFNAQRVRVDQVLLWKGVRHGEGVVNLGGAHVGELDDAPEDWPGKDTFLMDGFTYDRIKGKVSTPPERRKWLENGSYFKGEFRPQPMTQYAKFLQATGHDAQARNVLMRREALVREFERKEFSGIKRVLRAITDKAQQWLVGYGHDPRRSLYWLIVLILITALPAQLAWNEGSMAPNAAPVLVSETWQDLAAKPRLHLPNPAEEWSNSVPGRDWETFNAVAYGLDVVIPIIDFGQTDAWAPSTSRQVWGQFLYWWRWVMTVAGWIVTAVGAAAITGIIRRD